MKLLVEQRYGTSDIKPLIESVTGKPKQYFIEGVFLQADVSNRNGRVYPRAIMEREVKRFVTEAVSKKSASAMGELGHPTGEQGPTLNMERVSHVITDLRMEGNDVIGRAKILDTPYGKITKTFMDEGIVLGVSSRGLGSVQSREDGVNEVQDDFHLATVDIVAEPSCRDAVVESIMEGKDWDFVDGQFIEKFKSEIKNAKGKRQLEEAKLKAFQTLLKSIKT